MNIKYRSATYEDTSAWEDLRNQLWPHCPSDKHKSEITEWLNDNTKECILAVDEERIVGFVEISTRSIADGCSSSPVAYIEGWFVLTNIRKSGVGKGLLHEAENWAKRNNMTEIASDTEIDNQTAIDAHKRIGFQEVDRVVQFKKVLS